MTKFQAQLPNGSWITIDETRATQLIREVLNRESWYAPRVGRKPMTTSEQVVAFLETGKTLNWGSDWYAQIRTEPGQQPIVTTTAAMVHCTCGHTVAKNQVMRSSSGTCCPDCYDRMSN